MTDQRMYACLPLGILAMQYKDPCFVNTVLVGIHAIRWINDCETPAMMLICGAHPIVR